MDVWGGKPPIFASDANTIIYFYADVNKFNKKLKDTMSTEREKLILEVEVADQTASTEFFLNGEPIKPSNRIEIKNLGGGKHQLIFNCVELTDQGEIKCKSGRLKSTCQLTVNKGEGKPEINLESPIEGPTGKMLIIDVPYTGDVIHSVKRSTLGSYCINSFCLFVCSL